MSSVCTRSDEEIDALIFALEKEINNLPEFNAFGDSNEEFKEELRDHIQSLYNYKNNNLEDVNDEVMSWIRGSSHSDLSCYV